QSAHSKPGGTNCLDCGHSRPTVGRQQVFTQERVLLDITLIKKMYCCPSDTQEAFFASLKPRSIKATTIGGTIVRKRAQATRSAYCRALDPVEKACPLTRSSRSSAGYRHWARRPTPQCCAA